MIATINKFRKIFRESKYSELLYLIAITSYSFLMCFSSSEIIKIPNLLKISLYLISLLFSLPKVLSQNYTKNELIICSLMYIFTLIYSISNHSIMLFIIPSLLIGVKNSNTKTIAKIVLIICMSFIIIHTISFTIYYLKNIGTISTYLRFHRDVQANHMHSYNHNRYGMRWVCSYISYLFLTNRDNKRYVKGIILTFLSIFVFALCQSKACFIIMLGLCFYVFIEKYKLFDKFVQIIKWASLIFSLSYSFIIQFLDLNNPFVALLNKITTTRVELAIANRINLGIHFFVSNFNQNSYANYTKDNLILEYELEYGLFFVICLTLFIIYICFMHKNNTFNNFVISLMFIMALSQRTPRHITLTLIPLLIMHNYFSIEDSKSKFII